MPSCSSVADLKVSSVTTSSIRLRRLLRDEVAVGQTIQSPVMDIDGRTLFPAGRKLSETDIQNIAKRGGYVEDASSVDKEPTEQVAEQPSADEPSLKEDAQQIMQDLSMQHGSSKGKGSERREHVRRNWQTVINIIVEQQGCSLVSEGAQMQVVTQDISSGGFGFVTNRYMYAGTRVLATFDALPNKPTLRGVICDCHLIGGMQHRVGIRFTDIVKRSL